MSTHPDNCFLKKWTWLLLYISVGFLYIPVSAAKYPLWPWLTLQFFFFCLYFYGIKLNLNLKTILALGISSRVLLLSFTNPIWENDFWRYLWEGSRFIEGFNPFLHPPNDPAFSNITPDYKALIGYPHLSSIYPPVAQYIFALCALISKKSLLGFKIVFLIFDLLTFFIFKKIIPYIQKTKDIKAENTYLYLYFLNPLLLKEVSNSLHIDIASVFFTLLFLLMFLKFTKTQKNIFSYLATFSLALASLIKIYPIIFLPLILKTRRFYLIINNFLIFLGTACLMYLPFIQEFHFPTGSTKVFGEFWVFNSGVYQILHQVLKSLSLQNYDVLLRAFLFLIFCFCYFLLLKSYLTKSETHTCCSKKYFSKLTNKSQYWIGHSPLNPESHNLLFFMNFSLIIMLFCSPVVNAWYILWLLPFAILINFWPLLIFCFLVNFGYVWWEAPSLYPYFVYIEWVIFLILIIFYFKQGFFKKKA